MVYTHAPDRHPWADTPLRRHPMGETPARADTPPLGRQSPSQTPPWVDTSPGYTPSETATEVGCTHPTGMHTC